MSDSCPATTITKAEAERGRYFDTRPQIVRDLLASRDRRILVDGPLGTGKAQPLDATVWTPAGAKKMGQIAAGDLVLAPDGSQSRVLAIHPQGVQPIFRVTFSTGEVVECTADHLWTVHYTGGGKRNTNRRRMMTATVTLADLRRFGKSRRCWVPSVKPVAFDSQPVPIDPYLMGVILGDGHVKPSGATTITTIDSELVESIRSALPSGHTLGKQHRISFGIRANRCSSQRRAKRGYVSRTSSGKWMARGWDNGKGVYLGSYEDRASAVAVVESLPPLPTTGPPTLADSLRAMGVAGKRAWEKSVPEHYLQNTSAVRLGVLQGLMDTDGTVDKTTGMPSFTSTSRQLAENVMFLVRSLGGAATITEKETNCLTAYTCWVRFDDGPALFRLTRKRKLAKRRTKYPVRRYIRSIGPAGEKVCQCIAIDHPDRLYLTDGFIPTHNTRLNLEKLRACCLKYPGCRWLLLRSVRKWLTNSALVTLEEKVLEPGLLIPDRIRRENRSEYRFLNGSVIVVAGLDDPQGVFSAEYDGAVLIEAIEIDQDTGEKVDGRLRYGRMPYQQFLMDCNPGAPTHWLKRSGETGWLRRMPMRHRDNPALYNADGTHTRFGRDYLGRLDGLTGVRRRRLRDGEWVQAEGVVYDGWDSTVHIVAPFAIPRHWRRYWSIDFGFTNPFVWQWWAEDDDGRLFLYREIYLTRRLVSDHAIAGLRAMHAWDETLQQPCWVDADDPRPAAVLCDHDAEDRATFERVVKLPTEPAPKAVDAGLQDVADRLKPADDGKPRIFIFRNARCHEPDHELSEKAKPDCTADEVDGYIWDPACRKGERPLKVDDHGMDAMRYISRYKAEGKFRPAEYGADFEDGGPPAGVFG